MMNFECLPRRVAPSTGKWFNGFGFLHVLHFFSLVSPTSIATRKEMFLRVCSSQLTSSQHFRSEQNYKIVKVTFWDSNSPDDGWSNVELSRSKQTAVPFVAIGMCPIRTRGPLKLPRAPATGGAWALGELARVTEKQAPANKNRQRPNQRSARGS